MSEGTADRAHRAQWLMLGGIFAAVVALLALGYFLFLRTEYVVLLEGARPADAAAVVAELDKGGRAYRLRDGGTTILVPANEADATRVAIAGSDVAARGQIGFELFNKSDMGLTNFAQKINYQRALQGELVRTIMAMEGVESARVHLALPERTLFRGDRAEPKAAVTVMMKPGQTADPLRVAGIQQLVAAAVPDLPENKVVVLDAAGRVISAVAVVEAPEVRSADLDERLAVEGYYRARARGAVERQLPALKFQLRVLALPKPGAANPDAASSAGSSWTPSGEGADRNFGLRFMFVSETPLGAEEQAVARDAIVQATAMDAGKGDTLSFETGPVDPPAVVQAAQIPAPLPSAALPPASARDATSSDWLLPGILAGAGLLLAALLGWRWLRGGAARLGDEDHEAFAARLRRQLNLTEGADAAA